MNTKDKSTVPSNLTRGSQGLRLIAFVAAASLLACSDKPPKVVAVKLDPGVTYVTTRYPEMLTTKQMRWLIPEGREARVEIEPPPGSLNKSGPTTILVHGYNVELEELDSYFSEIVSYLRDTQPQAGNFVVFDWPSGTSMPSRAPVLWVLGLIGTLGLETISDTVEEFNTAKENAAGITSDLFMGLLELIDQRTQGRPVDIVAHSMGCHLIMEGIKKRRILPSSVRKLIFLAPLLDRNVLEGDEMQLLLAQFAKVHIFYHYYDTALGKVGFTLGGEGPRDSALIPKNVDIHNVTSLLKRGDVHGAYLRRAGAEAISLQKALSE